MIWSLMLFLHSHPKKIIYFGKKIFDIKYIIAKESLYKGLPEKGNIITPVNKY